MKFMGSKRRMLTNGLGELLLAEVPKAGRFFDLFSGSGAVARHVACNHKVAVFASDLQAFSAVLAQAVVGRRAALDAERIWKLWFARASRTVELPARILKGHLTREVVATARRSCARKNAPITRSYGGHYFSPEQASWIDALRLSIPRVEPSRTAALAALIEGSSACAAAPGHTAQPFQPTRTSRRYLEEMWERDVLRYTKAALRAICSQHAARVGEATVKDANEAAKRVRAGDLVFVDPPYSGVQYSRFYHVLETIAVGECGEVDGIGRYPSPERRPRSRYSLVSESAEALDELLKGISSCRANAILTFPDHDCSNGLSGETVRMIAQRHFDVVGVNVESEFSSLGGRSNEDETVAGRPARKARNEMILVLRSAAKDARSSAHDRRLKRTAGA